MRPETWDQIDLIIDLHLQVAKSGAGTSRASTTRPVVPPAPQGPPSSAPTQSLPGIAPAPQPTVVPKPIYQPSVYVAMPNNHPSADQPPQPEVVEEATQQTASAEVDPDLPPPPLPLAGNNVMNVVMVGSECAPWSKTGERMGVQEQHSSFSIHVSILSRPMAVPACRVNIQVKMLCPAESEACPCKPCPCGASQA